MLNIFFLGLKNFVGEVLLPWLWACCFVSVGSFANENQVNCAVFNALIKVI